MQNTKRLGMDFIFLYLLTTSGISLELDLEQLKRQQWGYSPVGKTYSNLQSFMSPLSQAIHRDSYAEYTRLISMSQGSMPRVAVRKQSQRKWAVCHTDITVQS